jgi:ferredoxin-NADP reductase
MVTIRHARVLSASSPGGDARLLELAMDEPLGFTGGQYIIVDSGLTLPGGKAAKRAYSLLSSDAEQMRFTLAVKRIPGGPCSGHLHALAPGAALRFSGPWGKFCPAGASAGPTLIVATDTGVTAALGLLQGVRFRPRLATAHLLWLRPGPGDFLPDELVRAHAPRALGGLHIAALPPVHHPERVARARAAVAALLAELPASGAPPQVFACGDGAVNYALLDDLQAAGLPLTRDQLESFYNMPRKAA